ncbi:MAG: aldose 1-epimerase family protein [Flavobacteriia bacterium]|nr:aldose 1-epimerase family protein [Flavobacteriia bacterium]
MLKLRNEEFEVTINPIGAEICSFKSCNTNKEFIWSGDSNVWGSTAPVLFPIIGCLKDNHFIYTNKSYSIPKHGFIRNNQYLKITQLNEQNIEFRLKYDEESLLMFPFKFEFILQYKLVENKLIVKHEVINHDQVNPIYFSLGGHPAFKCPFNEDEVYEDYYLEFEQLETLQKWEVCENGLIGTNSFPFLVDEKIIPITHELFRNDALIFKNPKSKLINLKSKKNASFVQVEFTDFPYLGIWSKTNGDFVCIEPWQGISDSLDSTQLISKKEGIVKLKQKCSYHAKYSISIFD